MLKVQLLKDIKDLQLKKAEALLELWVVKREIADQRKGKNTVQKEQSDIEWRLSTVESVLKQTEQIYARRQADYSSLSESKKQEITKLSVRLQVLQKLIAEYEGKELIDIDTMNRNYKQQLSEKQKEMTDLEWKLVKARKEKELLDKENKGFEEYKMKEQDKLDEQRSELEKKATALEAYRKLLHNEA